MKLAQPLDDPKLQAKIQMYRDALDVRVEVPIPRNPVESPVPGVEYDDIGFPMMPEDLTVITSQELGRLYQATEAWHNYIAALATNADHDKVVSKALSDLIKVEVKKDIRASGKSKDDADEEYRGDPRYIQTDTEYLTARITADKLENARSMISRRIQFISREITRRGDDFYGRDPDARFRDANGTLGPRGRKL